MNKKHTKFILFSGVLILSQFALALQAMAYIGPGIAVVGIWSLFGPIAALVTLVLMVAYYPVMYFYKKHKKSKLEPQAETPVEQEENTGSNSP